MCVNMAQNPELPGRLLKVSPSAFCPTVYVLILCYKTYWHALPIHFRHFTLQIMHVNCFDLCDTENSASCIPNFRIFSPCWVSGLLTLCHCVCALPHFEGVCYVYLQRLSSPIMDCVQTHIFWLDIQLTPDIRLRSLATGMKQSYKGKGSTVSHHSRRILLLKLKYINPLKPELNPICYLLTLLGAHHFLHVSRIRVILLTFRLLMSYTYGAPILDVSRSHTTTQHSR